MQYEITEIQYPPRLTSKPHLSTWNYVNRTESDLNVLTIVCKFDFFFQFSVEALTRQ